jgi:RHS repeat-associated protein
MLMPDATQPLVWDRRDRLQRVTLVKRSGADDDREAYQYGGDGMRVRKRMTTQTGGTTRTVDVIYLPGVTLRVTSSEGKVMNVVERLQEISSEAGGIRARCLHWETGQPASLDNDAVRYGMGDRNGSIGLEFDDQASLISREEYYPYGGTAVWTARSRIEADKKFVRYSGKERDATGLYDYGYRYYQPWIGRWLNTDPAGTVDGLNLYRMVGNNPVSLRDQDGLAPSPPPMLEEDDINPHLDLINSFVDSQLQMGDLAGLGGLTAEDVAAHLGDAGSATPTYPTSFGLSEDGSLMTQPTIAMPPDPYAGVAVMAGSAAVQQSSAMHAGPSSVVATMDWTEVVSPLTEMPPWSRPEDPGPSTSGATHHGAAVPAAGPSSPALGPQATAAGQVDYRTVLLEARNIQVSISMDEYFQFFGTKGGQKKNWTIENNARVLGLIKALDKYGVEKIADLPGAPIMTGTHIGASGHAKSQGRIQTSRLARDLRMIDANYLHKILRTADKNPWKRRVIPRLGLWSRKT